MRKDLLVTDQIYHVFSRSIAGFKIFNSEADHSRIIQLLQYYKKAEPNIRFSRFNKLIKKNKIDFQQLHSEKENLIDIVAYCIMPPHLHLVLKQRKKSGISIFMNNILNSYTRFFNTKHQRKGPLWESRFKNVLVETNEYLLHLTRYMHLNPVTSGLVDAAELWESSSYKEYLSLVDKDNLICNFSNLIDISPKEYKIFVEERTDYQRELQKIKNLMLD
ncbi:MAG: transposase [Elusimicrobia bacterium]|nr:transposase [Elusimicrobiota bacterium]